MAKIVPIGKPRNDAERKALAYLRDYLPDCTVLHNLELEKDREILEIDQVVLTPHCLYVVDVKGVHGSVDIYSAIWRPQGRMPYASPLVKARFDARLLKTFLLDSHPALMEMRDVYVRGAVLLTEPDVNLTIHSDTDRYDVVRLNESVTYFQNKANALVRKSRTSNEVIEISPLLPLIESTIRSVARPISEKLVYGNWQVDDELGGNERFTDYRAHHLLAGKSGTARLRVYRADPYQDEAARKREQKILSNAYRAIINIPGHPNILNAREFIDSEDETFFVLVTEDVVGQTLGETIKNGSLTDLQKVQIIRDVLSALDHAHKYHVLHRNITPETIILSASAGARLCSFEYARAGASGTSTVAQDVKEWVDWSYQAPECYGDLSKATIASDLFSAGLVFYELLTGEPAFSGPTQAYDSRALFPVKPTERNPDLPPGLDDWLQKLCAFDPQNRFATAAEALEAFDLAITPTPSVPPVSKVKKKVLTPAQDPERGNLPEGSVLNERFLVQEKLGQGSFAVTYKVFDTTADIVRVIKLVLKDHVSTHQRMRQEYQTLVRLPDHPNVVKVIWADRLRDGIPYIVFEYVEGKSVEDLIREQAFSVEEAVQLAMQVAQGLQHIHTHGIYHQDIKPSNLLCTEHGVRIIDFNVAVSEQDDSETAGGTGRYLPPDLEGLSHLDSSQKIDRDVYALGVTLYECVTGHYPFNVPAMRKVATNPSTFSGCEDLNPALVDLLLKAISPVSTTRFASAQALLDGLRTLPALTTSAEPNANGVEPVDTPLQAAQEKKQVPFQEAPEEHSRLVDAGAAGAPSQPAQDFNNTVQRGYQGNTMPLNPPNSYDSGQPNFQKSSSGQRQQFVNPDPHSQLHYPPSATFDPMDPSSMRMRSTEAATLSYSMGWLSGLFFYFMEKQNRFVRFHAMQSLLFFSIMNILLFLVAPSPSLGPYLAPLIFLVSAIGWLVLMLQAGLGKTFKLPIIGKYAEKYADRGPLILDPSGPTSMGMHPNTAASLSYVLGWLSGIYILIKEKQNQFVRFHAMQSLLFFGILQILVLIPSSYTSLVFVVAIIGWIVLPLMAYQGKFAELPIVGDLAGKYANRGTF